MSFTEEGVSFQFLWVPYVTPSFLPPSLALPAVGMLECRVQKL